MAYNQQGYGGPGGGYGAQGGGYGGGGYGGGGYGGPGGGYGGGGYGGPPGGGYGGGPGGFSQPGRQAPPGADPQLWNWFNAVDTDYSGSISAPELQQALVNGDWTAFDLDTVKLLMTLFDTDRSGTVTFNEFSGLWKYIKDWQGVFKHFDRDRSGSIDGAELGQALSGFGYPQTPANIDLIQRKYGRGYFLFRRPVFVRCCVAIKQLSDKFDGLSGQYPQPGQPRHARVTMDYTQFMQTVLSLP